ncbi:hypothetical protein POJ06DRAFT_281948 [Lipomyces tetrasporus]|uniref:Uncharacterized protein n=1 Tax=Lipomyces tetrasporus TaxID=54092 RepID=A0AAD7QQR2_9ASCO|nr:uncharacterized protein POJ06DRAFT_281948 [Lipomyces tetrasporus]KAJ8099837.1 hypothetical protein POJ06DRAFT_281948 [Lipomyces tetrasporus]
MARRTVQRSHDEVAGEAEDEQVDVVVTATPVNVPRLPTTAFVAPEVADAAAVAVQPRTRQRMEVDVTVTPETDVIMPEAMRDDEDAAGMSSAIRAIDPAAANSETNPQNGQICKRCKTVKPRDAFAKPAGREGTFKFCVSCREQSRQHTSDTRKRKREAEKLSAEREISGGDESASFDGSRDVVVVTDFAQFTQNFPTPDKDIDPAITASSAQLGPDATTEQPCPLHQKTFILRSQVSVDGETTIGEALRELDGEPVELFKKIIQAIFNVTGFYFARRAKSKSGKSFRTQYVCSQVADTSNNRESIKAPKRARSRRQLFDCHGRLILAASKSDKSVIVKYAHRIVHGPAARRRYLPEIVKQYIAANRDKPLSDVFAGIKDLSAQQNFDPDIDISVISRKQVYIYMKRLEDSLRQQATDEPEGSPDRRPLVTDEELQSAIARASVGTEPRSEKVM